MYIESLHIGDFGGTKNRSITFENKINIIEGNNESGKSTLAAFISFMLYGFADKPQRKRFYSWGTKSASGTMTICSNGKRYRIEREHIESTGDKVTIIDLETNLPAFEGKKPEEVFFGVSHEIFNNTAYIGQVSGGYVGGAKVSASIENILFSADESVDTAKALKRLDEARVLLQHKRGKGGKIHELSEERDELIRRLDAAKSANQGIIEKEGSLRETIKSIETNENKLKEHKQLLEHYETAKQYRTYVKYKTLKKKAAELEALTEALKQSYTYNGFIPDEEYIAKLNSLQNEIKRLDEASYELQREIEQQRMKNSDLFEMSLFIDKVNENGGIDTVVSAHKKISKRKKLLSVFSVISFILAAGLGAVVGLTFKAVTSDFIIGALGAFSLLLLGLIFVICSSRQRINENELFAELDIDNKADFLEAVSRFVADENKLSLHNSRIRDLEGKYNQLLYAKKEKEEQAQAQAFLWGKNDSASALKSAAEALKLISENTSEAEKYSLASHAFEEQVAGIDPEALKEKLAGRPYEESSFDMNVINEALREDDFYSKATKCLKEKKTELEKELAVLYATVENPTSLSDKVNELTNTVSGLTRKLNGYVLAYEKLTEASEALRLGISPRLAENAASLLSKMTDGKYDSIGIDKNLEMKYEAEGKIRELDYMSAGTKDLAYYSLRLSLIELLYKDQLPPVIFDESFARLDDSRMDNFFRVIAQKEIQTLIFTSQKRDAIRMKASELEFNHIKL